MEDKKDPDCNFPSHEEFNLEASLANKIPGPNRFPVSHYFMWNSNVPPHLSPTNGVNGGKRKKVLVTMEEKLRALQRMDAGESAGNIAEELGVGKSTISDWKKHRIEIEKWYANQAGASCIKARKTMRKGKHAQVEKALYYWFEYVRSKGFQVSGPLLQQKALQFKDKIEGQESERFSASEGWLDRWKKRFGIGHLPNTIITQNEDDSFVEELKRDLLELDNIKEEQLYCCGRTLLNYRMLPTNILGCEEYKETTDCEINEESVIIFACSNATGNHKLRLSFVGKSEKFQAFENIKDSDLLPFWHSQQNDGWLDANVLKRWFKGEFVPVVEKYLTLNQLPRKAVLLVTNYPSFVDLSELEDGDIRVVFIPIQAASLCQPMNQGILESLKKKYWCRLLSSVISTSTDSESCLKTLKNVDIVEAIQFVLEAWDEIPWFTFVQAWKNLISQTGEKDWAGSENHIISRENDDKELVNILTRIVGSDDVSLQDVNEWLANEEDDDIVSEDIVAMIVKEPQHDLELSEGHSMNGEQTATEPSEIKAELPVLDGDSCAENIPPQIKRIRHTDGLKAISKALEYVSQQEDSTPEDLVWFLKWREFAAKNSLLEEKPKKSVKRPKLL